MGRATYKGNEVKSKMKTPFTYAHAKINKRVLCLSLALSTPLTYDPKGPCFMEMKWINVV